VRDIQEEPTEMDWKAENVSTVGWGFQDENAGSRHRPAEDERFGYRIGLSRGGDG